MKTSILIRTALALAALGRIWPQRLQPKPSPAQPFKITTPIAPGVATPNRLETSIGTLNLMDGFPKPDTIEKIYDNLNRSRAW